MFESVPSPYNFTFLVRANKYTRGQMCGWKNGLKSPGPPFYKRRGEGGPGLETLLEPKNVF